MKLSFRIIPILSWNCIFQGKGWRGRSCNWDCLLLENVLHFIICIENLYFPIFHNKQSFPLIIRKMISKSLPKLWASPLGVLLTVPVGSKWAWQVDWQQHWSRCYHLKQFHHTPLSTDRTSTGISLLVQNLEIRDNLTHRQVYSFSSQSKNELGFWSPGLWTRKRRRHVSALSSW